MLFNATITCTANEGSCVSCMLMLTSRDHIDLTNVLDQHERNDFLALNGFECELLFVLFGKDIALIEVSVPRNGKSVNLRMKKIFLNTFPEFIVAQVKRELALLQQGLTRDIEVTST